MRKDGLVFKDKEEEITFNFYSFCEVLKGCISKYCNISFQEAHDRIENCKQFISPISAADDVYFFSHEHPFHWAMICYYGDSYWDENPELTVIPEFYDDWESEYIKEHNLEKELFIFE